MSIRIRSINGIFVALCAAEVDEAPFDNYLGESEHHALFQKFLRDFKAEGLLNQAGEERIERAQLELNESQKKRDAEETISSSLTHELMARPFKQGPKHIGVEIKKGTKKVKGDFGVHVYSVGPWLKSEHKGKGPKVRVKRPSNRKKARSTKTNPKPK